MGIGQRKDKARELFIKGYTNAEVAREVGVHPDTVTRYRREYEQSVRDAANNNPTLLRDVVQNTVQALEHLDRVRAEAWKRYESAETGQVKATFLNTVLKAEGERAKILGLMGVKGDTLAFVQRIKAQQEQLTEHMRENLCDECRPMLIDFIVSNFSEDLQMLPTVPGA
jgi:transposase-like protein